MPNKMCVLFIGLREIPQGIAVNRNLIENSSEKKVFLRLQRDSNPWPLHSRCSALLAELGRPIHWRLANLLSSSTRERNETLQ